MTSRVCNNEPLVGDYKTSVDLDVCVVLTFLKIVHQNCTFFKKSLSSFLSFSVGNGC